MDSASVKQPPPIPGMRPPLGSPGGPVPAPKSSMGFVMPIYTICIIIFFVYTLSKILFKRTGTSQYEPLTPDPQFRRRVFRDDSRTSPDKLGPKERDTIVTAISGLVAEVQQQMEASYAQNQQRQDVQQDNQTRPYTNGTILHSSGPVHIVASEYQEQPKEKTLEPLTEKEESPVPVIAPETEKTITETNEAEREEKVSIIGLEGLDSNAAESEEPVIKVLSETIAEKEQTPELEKIIKGLTPELVKEATPELESDVKDSSFKVERDTKYPTPELKRETKPTTELETDTKPTPEPKETEQQMKVDEEDEDEEVEEEEEIEEVEDEELEEIKPVQLKARTDETKLIEANNSDELIKQTSKDKVEKNGDIRRADEFLKEETNAIIEEQKEKQTTPDLLEDAINDGEDNDDNENSSVKVVGMEMRAHMADGGACGATQRAVPGPRAQAPPSSLPRAHEAESVQSIFLQTDIPQQSRVLVAEFAEDRAGRPPPARHSPMVVSGKMTLSLIQDAPRETPERDPESTVDDFTTASAVTQDAAEKQDEESDEEIEEEYEIEEIDEEVEEIEEEEEEEPQKKEKEPSKKKE